MTLFLVWDYTLEDLKRTVVDDDLKGKVHKETVGFLISTHKYSETHHH